jgi:phage FluMu protein gp41
VRNTIAVLGKHQKPSKLVSLENLASGKNCHINALKSNIELEDIIAESKVRDRGRNED